MKIFAVIILLCLIIGCKHKIQTLNRELIGEWDNQNGCKIIFTIRNNKLLLVSFKTKNLLMKNIDLLSYKENGFIFIKTTNDKFNATYVDGDLFITNYCNPQLHKINNF